MTDLDAEGRLRDIRPLPRHPSPIDPLKVHFSGYPALDATTVAEVEDYYLHGQSGAGIEPPPDPESARELGEPISGDEIARYAYWDATGDFPTYSDLYAFQRHQMATQPGPQATLF